MIHVKNFILLSLIVFISCGNDNTMSKNSRPIVPHPNNISKYSWEKSRKAILDYNNMVLLYGGGSQRTHQWNLEYTAPYVTYIDKDNKEHWLFDSFLFLEFCDGNGKMFASGYASTPANQQDWMSLANYYFQSNNALGALDNAIEAGIKRIGSPSTKREVIIGLPEPIKNQKEWGYDENGIKLDFAKDEDRVAACKWYIDYVRHQFDEMKYKNIDLAGFYWISEEATNTRTIINDIAAYLTNLKYSFNWIPYFKSDGYSEWKTLGFNYAYLQPNYFFDDKIPLSRLDDACKLANKYNMDMEMEFDERVCSGWGYRLKDYMAEFIKNGIWESKRLAYYQGDIALYNLSKSSQKEDRDLYHEFCEFIVHRPLY
jgi:hypothetical protein